MTETTETQRGRDENSDPPHPIEARSWKLIHRAMIVPKLFLGAIIWLYRRTGTVSFWGFLGGLVGVVLAYEANSLISKQNHLISEQSALLGQQTALLRSEYEFERVPYVALKGAAAVPMKFVKDQWEVALDAIKNDESMGLSLPTLVNYGKGPAFDVQVVWSGDDITDLSSTSMEHRQLYSGDFSGVPELPEFVAGKHATTGIVKIQYRDLDGKYHETRQTFRCHFDAHEGSGLYMVWVDQLLTMPNDPPLKEIAPLAPSWWHH